MNGVVTAHSERCGNSTYTVEVAPVVLTTLGIQVELIMGVYVPPNCPCSSRSLCVCVCVCDSCSCSGSVCDECCTVGVLCESDCEGVRLTTNEEKIIQEGSTKLVCGPTPVVASISNVNWGEQDGAPCQWFYSH